MKWKPEQIGSNEMQDRIRNPSASRGEAADGRYSP
jgi:hypothetical protein